MHTDDKELLDWDILKNAPAKHSFYGIDASCESPIAVYGDQGPKKEEQILRGLVQWTTSDGKTFIPASKTAEKITPGVYEIQHSDTIGIYFQKITVLAQGLLRFPQTNSERVVTEIQKFWERESLFREYKLTYKRGIILWGPPGCHAKGTKIVMYDGTKKNVEDVALGDLLMGPDSKPRKVLELRRGRDNMFRVTPMKGESFVVNGHHIFNLVRTRQDDRRYPPSMNISVNDFMSLTKCSQRSFKLHRTGVEFSTNSKLSVDPYFLGVWLGDGTEGNTQVTTADKEIREFLYNYAGSLGLSVTENKKTDSICSSFTIVGNGQKGGNSLRTIMNSIGVLDHKHIPEEYMTTTRQSRLALLAGLVDTDGGYSMATWRSNQKFKKKGYNGCFEIIQKRQELAEQIVELARSLGLGATIKLVKKSIKKINFVGEYWRVNIFGNISEVPVRLARKKALLGLPNKDPLRTGIRNIEPLGDGEYFGFTLSGDHLYITSDYMVHHNSGKSCTIQLIMRDVVDRGGIVVKFTHPSLFTEGMRVLREIEPQTPIVVLMEDIDSTIKHYNESEVLNILDGVNQIEKAVFLATTNYPEELGERIINRPSRFDKRFKIDHPNPESRKMYFEYLIGSKRIAELNIPIDKWVQDTEDFSLAHLKELFVAVVILGDEYQSAIDTLSGMREEQLDSSKDDFKPTMGFGKPKKRGFRD